MQGGGAMRYDDSSGPSPGHRHKPSLFTEKELSERARDFDNLLQIQPEDLEIVRKHGALLSEGAARFARVFYDYLFAFPATSEVLQRYQAGGGDIERLRQGQMRHLLDFLKADTSVDTARQLIHIGQIHFDRNIEPVWLMGAYRLYLEHLREQLHTLGEQLPAEDAAHLERALPKLLFRDIGLMLEGYWESAVACLRDEQDKLAQLQHQISSLLANVPQVLWSVDVIHNRPIYVSPTTRQICPLDAQMPIPCLGWTIPEDQAKVRAAWERALQGETVEVESRVVAPDGVEPRWFRRVFHPYADDSGTVVRIDGVMEDTTEAKHALQRLEHLATTDTLTDLANRALWYDRLSLAIAGAQRSGKQVALMLLDLNHFKMVNDTLGHPAGDELLRHVAQRLRQILRDTDTLARLGGDEFSIILPECDDPHAASMEVARKVLACFHEPFSLQESDDIYLGASIGIVFYPDHGNDADSLVSRADIAMYSAKRGDSGYFFYDPGSDAGAAEELQLSGWLRKALPRGEFELHFQPKVEIGTGRVCGMEALLRWHHPERGLIMPSEFISIAEQNGMITPITDWVLTQALEQCKHWRAAGLAVPVAINMSARSFQNRKLVERVEQALEQVGVSGECLEIEITENMLMADLEHGNQILGRLSQCGVGVAIDDFGTGYSSLAYLKSLPIRTVKIDKSFILDMGENDNDAVIVRSIVDLGHNLGFQVIAEGVETLEAWQLLEILGCDAAQGYFISRPAPAESVTDWLHHGACRWYPPIN